MLLSAEPSLPVSGSGSQPGQYTGALIRFARRCQASRSGQDGFAGFVAASAFFASLPQPDTTVENARSRQIANSPLTGAMVAAYTSSGWSPTRSATCFART